MSQYVQIERERERDRDRCRYTNWNKINQKSRKRLKYTSIYIPTPSIPSPHYPLPIPFLYSQKDHHLWLFPIFWTRDVSDRTKIVSFEAESAALPFQRFRRCHYWRKKESWVGGVSVLQPTYHFYEIIQAVKTPPTEISRDPLLNSAQPRHCDSAQNLDANSPCQPVSHVMFYSKCFNCRCSGQLDFIYNFKEFKAEKQHARIPIHPTI